MTVTYQNNAGVGSWSKRYRSRRPLQRLKPCTLLRTPAGKMLDTTAPSVRAHLTVRTHCQDTCKSMTSVGRKTRREGKLAYLAHNQRPGAMANGRYVHHVRDGMPPAPMRVRAILRADRRQIRMVSQAARWLRNSLEPDRTSEMHQYRDCCRRLVGVS